jgi:hypothetical protein
VGTGQQTGGGPGAGVADPDAAAFHAALCGGGTAGQQQQQQTQQQGPDIVNLPYSILIPFLDRQISAAEMDKIYEELDLDGTWDRLEFVLPMTARDVANQCNDLRTGSRQEWTGTFRDTTGMRATQSWPKMEMILRLVFWSVNTQ